MRTKGTPDIAELLRRIRELVEQNNAKRLVIDSITAFCRLIKDEAVMREFMNDLADNMEILGCTSLLISEIPPGEITYSIYGVEEFISDGIILLGELERKGDLLGTLQIIKMRGVEHPRSMQILHIAQEGIRLMPMFEAYSK